MKYIRTKDGQIIKHPHPSAEIFTFRYEIEKVADTIEELCDEFVVIKGAERLLLYTTDDIETYLPHKVYGAIWTDKGLIYVAKMNDKGELELL